MTLSGSRSEYKLAHSFTERDLLPEAVDFIIAHEGWHGESHYPYVGYGHRLTDNDNFNHNISREFAKELVKKDLLGKCSVFREYGRDSLLLGMLAYNVGEGNVKRSTLLRKLRSGSDDFYDCYISFCKSDGKEIISIKRRRIKEFNQFYNKTKVTRNGFNETYAWKGCHDR